MDTNDATVKIGEIPEALAKTSTEDSVAAQRAMDEFQALTLGKKEMNMTELYTLKQYAKKRTDLTKSDGELGTEEAIWKAIYSATEDLIVKNMNPEEKAKIDSVQEQMDSLTALASLIEKMTPLGREIETELTMQGAGLLVYFTKGPENEYKTVVDGVTTDLVNPDKWTPSERIEKAKTVLTIINANREYLYKTQLVQRHEVIHSKLREFDSLFKHIESLAVNEKVVEELSVKTLIDNSREWLKLTKDLYTSRTSAISAVKNSLESDEFLPKLVLEKNGDVGDKIKEVNPFFEQMAAVVVLINKASDEEKAISAKRDHLSEVIFGKPESYMNLGQKESEPKNTPAQNQASGGMSTQTKWIIVVVLSVVALSWGIWTAIGVFVLGAIMVGVLSK